MCICIYKYCICICYSDICRYVYIYIYMCSCIYVHQRAYIHSYQWKKIAVVESVQGFINLVIPGLLIPMRNLLNNMWMLGPGFMASQTHHGNILQRCNIRSTPLHMIQSEPESWSRTVLQPQSLETKDNQHKSSQIHFPTFWSLLLLQSPI